jgi:hypothetical protein
MQKVSTAVGGKRNLGTYFSTSGITVTPKNGAIVLGSRWDPTSALSKPWGRNNLCLKLGYTVFSRVSEK